MSVTENLLSTVRFVVDPDGNRQGVLLSMDTWEDLLELLEDIEDTKEMAQLRQSDEEVIPWEQAKAELQAKGIDV